MSFRVSVEIINAGKCYQDPKLNRLGSKSFAKWFVNPFASLEKSEDNPIWALRPMYLSIKKGETFGIIGKNGSGKSTLLQLITGTIAPTIGTIQTNGKVAALLELGSGFNPEFTGRENLYLNGMILGLTKKKIKSKIEDIIAFAEIGDFLDRPIKTYSSGMIVRLAFAVYVNSDPDILIIDEALAVGDELFQRKCFAKLEEIKNGGATIIFVSHSAAQIIELCDTAVLLDEGEMISLGDPKMVVSHYHKILYAPKDLSSQFKEQQKLDLFIDSQGIESEAPKKKKIDVDCCAAFFDSNMRSTSKVEYETNGAVISNPRIVDLNGMHVNHLVKGNLYRWVYDVLFTSDVESVRFGMMIKSSTGLELGGGISFPNPDVHNLIKRGTVAHVDFKFKCSLNQGTYFLNSGVLGIKNGVEIFLHRILDHVVFKVQQGSYETATGVVDFDCVATIGFIKYEKQ